MSTPQGDGSCCLKLFTLFHVCRFPGADIIWSRRIVKHDETLKSRKALNFPGVACCHLHHILALALYRRFSGQHLSTRTPISSSSVSLSLLPK